MAASAGFHFNPITKEKLLSLPGIGEKKAETLLQLIEHKGVVSLTEMAESVKLDTKYLTKWKESFDTGFFAKEVTWGETGEEEVVLEESIAVPSLIAGELSSVLTDSHVEVLLKHIQQNHLGDLMTRAHMF